MNEVRSSQIASLGLANSASSKGAKETPSSASGKALPQDAVKEEKIERSQKEPSSAKDLQSAVANVEGYVQSMQRDLQFTVDEDLDQTVVKVLDSDSGEIIRQIPEAIFLELARRLKDDGEFRLLNALG
ncbi:MAG: flagellar protein FlaG [Agarilytica sp.]